MSSCYYVTSYKSTCFLANIFVDNSAPPTCTYCTYLSPSSFSSSFFPASPSPWPRSLKRRVRSSFHNEKWAERLAALCYWMEVVCSSSRDAKGLVGTDKAAAASGNYSYPAIHIIRRMIYPILCHLLGRRCTTRWLRCEWKFLKMICALQFRQWKLIGWVT